VAKFFEEIDGLLFGDALPAFPESSTGTGSSSTHVQPEIINECEEWRASFLNLRVLGHQVPRLPHPVPCLHSLHPSLLISEADPRSIGLGLS
jgi:hypothetical protein